jgi:glyoxylase-like metal-dependent hydrolase (beta-lactamase superfamily II)/8-oxo-dGTP pyrophosphatase MutT (NUDIX family)
MEQLGRPGRISEAASVLLARAPSSPEVLVVRRNPALRFFGGFWAFPGGKVDPRDSAIPLEPSLPPDTLAARRTAAARELFEETGVLLARAADGSFPHSADLEPWRSEVAADRLSFSELLLRLGLTLHAADLRLIGSVTTPAFAPIRFDTTFFVASLPPGQEATVWPGELDEGRWATAATVLDSWRRGEYLVSPPTVMTLEAVRDRPAEEAPARLGPLLEALSAGRIHPIFFSPEVQLIPLRTIALAPSTHTNAYLVGRDPAYLIDPGPSDPAEQQRLFHLLDERLSAGLRLAAVVLTHHHPDHVGAVEACAGRYRVPVWAHRLTAERLRSGLAVGRFLEDGERLDLGACPDGAGPWWLEAVHTPGHAPGHLAFHEPRYRLLLAGDMVSTVSSVVIAPPEGDLGVYLASLRRLQGLDCRLLLPAHGNVSARPAETLRECLEHRARREEQLVQALREGPRGVAELAGELYRGLPGELLRFARLQLLAGLLKLQREGRAEVAGEGEDQPWRLVEG